MDAAVNKQEVEAYKERVNKRQKFEGDTASTSAAKTDTREEEEVKPVVPLSACIERFTGDEMLPDYRSPATGTPGLASKRVRMGNFPKYMLIKLSRCVTWSSVPDSPSSKASVRHIRMEKISFSSILDCSSRARFHNYRADALSSAHTLIRTYIRRFVSLRPLLCGTAGITWIQIGSRRSSMSRWMSR